MNTESTREISQESQSFILENALHDIFHTFNCGDIVEIILCYIFESEDEGCDIHESNSSQDVESDNHLQNISSNISGKSMEKTKNLILKYLRDVKRPLLKRSMGHLIMTFRNLPEVNVALAIADLIRENKLIHERNSGVVGGKNSMVYMSEDLRHCSKKDWIIYNYNINKRLDSEKDRASIAAWDDKTRLRKYCHDHPYPCIDKQILSSRSDTNGKWTKGQTRIIGDSDSDSD